MRLEEVAHQPPRRWETPRGLADCDKGTQQARRLPARHQPVMRYGRNEAMVTMNAKRNATHRIVKRGEQSPLYSQAAKPAAVLANGCAQHSTATDDCTRRRCPAILHVQAAAPSAVVLSVAKLRNDDTHSGLTFCFPQHCPPSTTRLTTPKKRGRRPRCSRQYMNAASATESTR